jgi:DNA-binding CsgD family transcriptional regulator
VTGDTRHLDFAERLAREAIGNPATYRLRASVSWQTLGIAAVLRKDRGACDAAYRALSPMPRYIGNFPFVEKERLLALLASRVGMHDEAAGHFERSLAFCRQARYPLELAWTCHDFAAFLADRAEPGDAAYGTTLAREGIAVARRYGLTVAADRLSRLRRRLLAMRQRREPLAGGLTEAEARVLDLLERGLSNKAMSSELTVSVATVATHIRSIYRKLGVANRTEAAVRATALRSGNKYRLNG